MYSLSLWVWIRRTQWHCYQWWEVCLADQILLTAMCWSILGMFFDTASNTYLASLTAQTSNLMELVVPTFKLVLSATRFPIFWSLSTYISRQSATTDFYLFHQTFLAWSTNKILSLLSKTHHRYIHRESGLMVCLEWQYTLYHAVRQL